MECDVFNLGSDVDPTIVYRCLLSHMLLGSKGGILDTKKEEQVADEKKKEEKKKQQGESKKPAGNTLGTNGWHRALDILHTPPPFFEKIPNNKTIQSSHDVQVSSTKSLDQLTVTHILQHSHPQLDEYSAIQQEYDYLLEEIISLEKDRLVLEEEFDEVPEKMASSIIISSSQEQISKKGKEPSLSYSTFRTNLRYMKSEDMKMLPVMWLEDVPLEYSSSPPDNAVGSGSDNNNNDNSNNTNRKLYTKLDKPFQDLIRNHRGIGLALLIADPQCKTSLIGRCYMNSNLGTVGNSSSKSPPNSAMTLKRNGAATLIDEGGEWLKHCAITGFDTNADNSDGEDGATASSGTTYFLKFDSGKTHHRGDLPSNLVARLYREEKEPGSIKYLSTGCSYSATNSNQAAVGIPTGGGQYRCYYAEFDNGECWWGTNKDDVLDGIFMEMDVHRVAFGTSSSSNSNNGGSNGGGTPTSSVVDKSSWVVIGKDGSVKWKNVPQGLHDVLTATQQDNTASTTTQENVTSTSAAVAPCEISLGIGGTYFIRFLDGRVDYSLPNFVADVFDKFEADGKLIRNVALHVDTYDCLIRYSKEMMSESS